LTNLNGQTQQAVQSIFYCPTRRPAGLYPGSVERAAGAISTLTNGTTWGMVAKTDYAANGGSIGFNYSAQCTFSTGTTSCNGANNPNDTNLPQGIPPANTTSLQQVVSSIPVATYNWYLAPYPKGSTSIPYAQYTLSKTTPTPGTSFTGPVWYRSQVALRQLTDGASKVYLFGEKYVSQMSYDTMGDANSDMGNIYQGMDEGLIRMGASGGVYAPQSTAVAPLAQPNALAVVEYYPMLYPPVADSPVWNGGLGGPNTNTAPKNVTVFDFYQGIRFGSAHAGGFNMAFCDGSVHSITYDIDATIHAMLSDRQDGNTPDASVYLGQ
jgi:prepilin-type processing-associated H-X9-DG protein